MRFILSFAIISAIPLAAMAQQENMRSIEDTASSMSDEKLIDQYVYSRCSGLYDGIIGYAGGNLTSEVANSFKDNSTIFSFAVAVTKQQNAVTTGRGPTELDPHIMQTVLEVERFANLYIERFRSNYDLNGSMFENDEMSKKDIALCQQAFPVANQITNEALGN